MSDLSNEPHYWKELFTDLWQRFIKPFKYPTFVGYFLLIVVGVGAFGIFDPLVRNYYFHTLSEEEFVRTFSSAVYTYFVAIAATAVTDIVISPHEKKSFSMAFLLGGAVVIICALLSAGSAPKLAVVPSAIGYIVALLLWWLSNANNAHLHDYVPPPTAPTGGSVDTQVAGDIPPDFKV